MGQKTIREISVAWKEYKQPYVKQSTMAAYVLILENHILPNFGESDTLHEQAVQDFVLWKIENGLSVKSVKDILIVLKMVMKFGVKNEWMDYQEWDIKYPTAPEKQGIDVLIVIVKRIGAALRTFDQSRHGDLVEGHFGKHFLKGGHDQLLGV